MRLTFELCAFTFVVTGLESFFFLNTLLLLYSLTVASKSIGNVMYNDLFVVKFGKRASLWRRNLIWNCF